MTGPLAQINPVVAPSLDWPALFPVLIPAGGAVLLLMLGAVSPRVLVKPPLTPTRQRLAPDAATRGAPTAPATASTARVAWLTVLLAVLGLVVVASLWDRLGDTAQVAAFGNHFVSDRFSLFVSAVILAAVALSATTLPGWCQRAGTSGVEPYVLLLLSASGGVVMAGAGDLIELFLGLETLSIALYVMAALDRRQLRSLEAGIKYFVLGAFSSAFLLYGIALIYGATGTTSLDGISDYFAEMLVLNDGLLLLGLAMLLVGLGFKVAAVPFHTWVPDVYEGAPSPVTAFMASAVKAAAFAAVVRVFVVALGERSGDWRPVVFVLACATLVVGAVLAAVQNDVKRMLAYSSISHAGFILVGVQASSVRGVAAVLFYLAAYSMIAMGSFTVVSLLPRAGSTPRSDITAATSAHVASRSPDAAADTHVAASGAVASRQSADPATGAGAYRGGFAAVAGLGARRPGLALAFTVLLLAQAGVPLTSGFVAKLSVIAAAAEAGASWLAVVAMLSAVIAAFAYLRVVVAMYFVGASTSRAVLSNVGDVIRVDPGAAVVIGLAVTATLVLGVFPDLVDSVAREAASLLTIGGS